MTELRNVVLFMALVYGLGLFLLGLYVRGVREDRYGWLTGINI